MKKWIVAKLWKWFGWNLTGRPVLFTSQLTVGTLPPEKRQEIPIIYKREVHPDYSTPEHGTQTGIHSDQHGTYGIWWDGIRRREVFICTRCKRIYDVVPKHGCGRE